MRAGLVPLVVALVGGAVRAGLVPSVVALVGGCGRLGFYALDGDRDAAGADLGPRLTYPQSVLADLPRAYYRLGEQMGMPLEDSANTWDATVMITNNGVIAYEQTGALPGDPNTAIGFDADGNAGPRTDAWAELPEVWSTWSGDFTIEVFTRPLSPPPPGGFHNAILNCEHYLMNGFRSGWRIDMTPGVWTDQAGHSAVVVSPIPLVLGAWNHVAFIHRGNTMEIFIDAQLVVTSPFDYAPPDQMAQCGFGSFHGEPSNGVLDELAIYDRALTQAQLAAHVAAAQP